MEKSLRLPITNPRYQIATKQVQHRTMRGSWRELATSQVRNTILEREPRCRLPPPTSAPWQWGSLEGKVRLDLLGGSRRTHSEGSRLVDAIATISSYGPLDLTIFTDGSVEEGAGESGSAAVFCRGTLANLQVIDVQGRQGARLASSFDAEVSALRVATEWLVRRGVPGRYLICSDSRAALAALQSGSATTSADLHELRQRLRGVPGEIFLQWVPGHCGLPGNELADRAAGAARHVAGPRLGISYGSAKAFCRRTIRDPPQITIGPLWYMVIRPCLHPVDHRMVDPALGKCRYYWLSCGVATVAYSQHTDTLLEQPRPLPVPAVRRSPLGRPSSVC